jgi:hypothetical protein
MTRMKFAQMSIPSHLAEKLPWLIRLLDGELGEDTLEHRLACREIRLDCGLLGVHLLHEESRKSNGQPVKTIVDSVEANLGGLKLKTEKRLFLWPGWPPVSRR